MSVVLVVSLFAVTCQYVHCCAYVSGSWNASFFPFISW